MEPKKLAKPRKNGAFLTRQAVMKPDEETGGLFSAKNTSRTDGNPKGASVREVFAFATGSAGRQRSKVLLRAAQKEGAHAGQIGQAAPMRGNGQPGRFKRRLPGGRQAEYVARGMEAIPQKERGQHGTGRPGAAQAGGNLFRRGIARDGPHVPPIHAERGKTARQQGDGFAAVAHKNGGTALIRGRKRAMQHSGQIAAVDIAGEQRDAGRKTGKPPGKRQHPPQERLIFAPPPQEHRLAQHRAEPFRGQAGKGFLRVLLPGRGVQAGTADRCAGKAGARFPLQFPERTAEAHEEQGRLPRAHVRRRAAGRRRRRSRR